MNQNDTDRKDQPSLPNPDLAERVSVSSFLVSSVREDYLDLQDIQWDYQLEGSAIMRLERYECDLKKVNGIDLSGILPPCRITKIEMPDLPPAQYTLNTNGTNIMSTRSNVFDLNSFPDLPYDYISFNDMNKMRSNFWYTFVNTDRCANNSQCNIPKPDGVLSMPSWTIDSLRICHPKTITLPESINISVTGYYDNSGQPTTKIFNLAHADTYAINMCSPTPFMILDATRKAGSPASKIMFYINGTLAFTSSIMGRNVVRFDGKEKTIHNNGMMDRDLAGKGVRSVNFSRVDMVRVVLIGCDLKVKYYAYQKYELPLLDPCYHVPNKRV